MFTNLKKYWPVITIGIILSVIIGLNLHPQKIIIGNDNFSPELDPGLTISRSLFNPAWRDNRVLGIPSDSEQTDLWRTIFFWIGEKFLPTWVISQGYLFLTLIIGVVSMGKVSKYFSHGSRLAEFFGSLLYLFSPITIWLYFYPVHLFVAAYAFTPLLIWRILVYQNYPTRSNKLLILLSSLLLGTSALTATMFIISSFTIFCTTIFYALSTKSKLKTWLIAFLIYILPQLFWILPFVTYVISNNLALQNSTINREITATTVASEQSNNTWDKTLRFASAWMDSKEDDQNYTYQARAWFRENQNGINLGYLSAVLSLIGILILILRAKQYPTLLPIPLLGLFGFLFLNGPNPPFGSIYLFFDKYIPLFHQVFRWNSSKFWPLLFFPLILLSSFATSKLITYAKYRLLQLVLTIVMVSLTIYSVHPLLSYKLIRDEVFVNLPNEYQELKSQLANQKLLVDTTPHTNTRYFRKHTWGFWGSVFLNYLLPNPTTEKALIIGSDENQSAFNTISEAYNSGNPNTYVSALDRFNISYVLSDRSVTNEGLGNSYSFPYDWDLHDKAVTNSPYLDRIWQQNFLSLYRVRPPQSPTPFTVNISQNLEYLNKILAITHNNNQYLTSEIDGDIFPFTNTPETLELNDIAFSLTSRINSTGDYRIDIPKELLSDSLLIASIQNNKLIIKPYFPEISLNQLPLYTLPTITINSSSEYITLDNQLISRTPSLVTPDSLTNVRSWSNPQNSDLLPLLKPTPCNRSQIDPENQSCYSADLDLNQSSVVYLTTTLSSPNSTLVDICIHSRISNTCLNSPGTHILGSEPQSVSVAANNIVPKGDNLIAFFVFKTLDNSKPKVDHTQLIITQLTSPQPVFVPKIVLEDISHYIVLERDQILTLRLPHSGVIQPLQYFMSKCPDRLGNPQFIRLNSTFTFTTTNCFDGVFTSFSLPEKLSIKALLTYARAHYKQGVPLGHSLKQDRVFHNIATEIFPINQAEFLQFTILPESNQNFTAELINKGIGKIPSTNTLEEFTIIPIPANWLSLRLSSINTSIPSLVNLDHFMTKVSTGTYIAPLKAGMHTYVLPTATSPYWKAAILTSRPNNITSLYWTVLTSKTITEKSLVNGWQPAWTVQSAEANGKYVGVIFLPNLLAYFGLFVGLGLSLILILVRQKSSTTHAPSSLG